jgi:hypothetical protein
MGKHLDEAVKLIAVEKFDAAEAIADDIDEAISELEDDRDLIYEILERMGGRSEATARPKRKVVKPKAKPQMKLPLDKERKPRLRVIAGDQRSEFIKRFAQDLVVKANGSGKLAISDVAQAITAAGFDLGTAIPGTVIANVLLKDKAHWARTERGVFKYVGQPQ